MNCHIRQWVKRHSQAVVAKRQRESGRPPSYYTFDVGPMTGAPCAVRTHDPNARQSDYMPFDGRSTYDFAA